MTFLLEMSFFFCNFARKIVKMADYAEIRNRIFGENRQGYA